MIYMHGIPILSELCGPEGMQKALVIKQLGDYLITANHIN